MNLIELCEPLFNYICKINRICRTGQVVDFDLVRTEIKDILAKAADQAKQLPALAEQYKLVELPLIFFIDSIIVESALPFSVAWNQKRLAYERNELAGDEKFFDILDETLQQTTPAANERLAIYYTCIGLGFKGWYQAQPEYLRKKMRQISSRITDYVEGEDQAFITPDAYQCTNTINLPMPVSDSITPMLIVLVGLIILVAGLNFYLFKRSSSELHQALQAIMLHEPSAKTATDKK